MKARKKSELIDLVKIDRADKFMDDKYILLLSDGTYRDSRVGVIKAPQWFNGECSRSALRTSLYGCVKQLYI